MTTGLSVQGISYRYGAREALRDVSFAVEAGRFCALLGPNGAGKSTLFALLTRLFTTPSGLIVVAGHNLAREPLKALARMGVVFQQSTLDLDLTVRRNLLYFAALHGLPGRQARVRVEEALDRLGMAERAGELVRNLNGGHRRRMELARALVHRPAVLLLDEPTVGLDAASRAAITDHVHQLANEGLAVLWATHLTDEVRLQDHLLILHRGRLLANDTAAAVADGQSLQQAFLNLTASSSEDGAGGGLNLPRSGPETPA